MPPTAALSQAPWSAQLTQFSTLDRSLVHREAIAEVFLTDTAKIDEGSYAASAQLPRSHSHFGDSLPEPPVHDCLLVLEACRQAALCGAHRYYGVPREDKFILTHTSVRAIQQAFRIDSRPTVLLMEITIVNHKQREGRTTGLDYEIALFADGKPAGTAELGLRFKAPNRYRELRLSNRNGIPPKSSGDYPPDVTGTAVTPHRVGRANPDNVILLDAKSATDRVSARLRTPVDHPSLFDHAQDHLPGAVLAESARQLAVYAGTELYGFSAAKLTLTEIDMSFANFGELEPDTYLTATRGAPGALGWPETTVYTQAGSMEIPTRPAGAPPAATRINLTIDIEQHEQSIATANCTLDCLIC